DHLALDPPLGIAHPMAQGQADRRSIEGPAAAAAQGADRELGEGRLPVEPRAGAQHGHAGDELAAHRRGVDVAELDGSPAIVADPGGAGRGHLLVLEATADPARVDPMIALAELAA